MWNDERTQALREMWAEGLSASQIAGRIGSVTRNAVIGKIHRLGLSGRARRERDNARRHKEPIGQKAIVGELFRKVHLPSEPVSFAEDLVPTVRNLLDLEAHHCRWIPGEVRGGFCGRNVVNGLVYCEFHAKRAYVPPKTVGPDGKGIRERFMPGAQGRISAANTHVLDALAEFTAA